MVPFLWVLVSLNLIACRMEQRPGVDFGRPQPAGPGSDADGVGQGATEREQLPAVGRPSRCVRPVADTFSGHTCCGRSPRKEPVARATPWSEGPGIHEPAFPGTKPPLSSPLPTGPVVAVGGFVSLFHLPFVPGAVRRYRAAHRGAAGLRSHCALDGRPACETHPGGDLSRVTRQQINNLLQALRGEMGMF